MCEVPEPRTAEISGIELSEARTADLLGAPRESLPITNGVLRLNLKPWEIKTVQIR